MNVFAKVLVCAALVAVPATSNASVASQKLALSQAAANVDVSQLPVCSKSVKTNCKKRGDKKAWIAVGAGLAAVVGVALASGSDSVSP